MTSPRYGSAGVKFQPGNSQYNEERRERFRILKLSTSDLADEDVIADWCKPVYDAIRKYNSSSSLEVEEMGGLWIELIRLAKILDSKRYLFTFTPSNCPESEYRRVSLVRLLTIDLNELYERKHSYLPGSKSQDCLMDLLQTRVVCQAALTRLTLEN